jgi:hypothetical protein
MKNIHIMRLCGLAVLICFLFMPVAGCGALNITGLDLIKMKDVSAGIKIFSVIALLFAVAIVFLPDKTKSFFCSIGGLVSLLIAYFIAKGKMSSGNDFGMSDAIDLKSGSYLSFLGFAATAVIAKIKNELFPASQNTPANPGNTDPPGENKQDS